MRKAALIFMVCAMFAAVLLPTTAQALLQPGLSVVVRDGHAVMDGASGETTYHFTAIVRNGWNRDMFVTCSFRVYHGDGNYTGNPGPGLTDWTMFGDVTLSARFHPGTTKVALVAHNQGLIDDLGTTKITQWNVWKRGCFKGPNHSVNWYI